MAVGRLRRCGPRKPRPVAPPPPGRPNRCSCCPCWPGAASREQTGVCAQPAELDRPPTAPVPTVRNIGRRPAAPSQVPLVMLLDQRLGLQREPGELIEGDPDQPYLDGAPARIDRRAHPAGAVPLQPVRPSPCAAVLLGKPFGQFLGPL